MGEIGKMVDSAANGISEGINEILKTDDEEDQGDAGENKGEEEELQSLSEICVEMWKEIEKEEEPTYQEEHKQSKYSTGFKEGSQEEHKGYSKQEGSSSFSDFFQNAWTAFTAEEGPQGDTQNHYEILGVDKNSTPGEIKKKFRKAALRFHPDKNRKRSRWAKKEFTKVAYAYEVLSNPEKKRIYDANSYFGLDQ